MTKRNFIYVIVFFLTAVFFLAERSSSPIIVSQYLSQPGTILVKQKEDKSVKPYSKIKKVKIKARYKASEVKFTLNTIYLCEPAPALFVKAVPVNHQYHLAKGFHFTKKLRGPPAVI